MIPAAIAALGHLLVERGIVVPWHLASQAFASATFCTATVR